VKLYIAGPMSGMPDNNYPSFHEAARQLREAGFEIENPADNINDDPDDYTRWLRLGFAQVIECDGVAYLSGFGQSTGAMAELYIAKVLKMPIRSVAEWLEHGSQ
jgi:hypothetical protein